MRALLIVNPNATSTTPTFRSMVARALAGTLDLEVVSTNHRGHARELAAGSTDHDLVIGFGGDGTLNEIVNGLVDLGTGTSHGPKLGVIPGGDVNVFARAAGISADPSEATEQLLESIQNHRTRELNLGLIRWGESELNQSRIFNFSAGFGLDAAVVHEVDRLRKDGTQSSIALYVMATGKAILEAAKNRDSKPLTLVSADKSRQSLSVALITTTDPWTYLKEKPLRPTPRASFATGLDMMGITSNSASTLFKVAQTLMRGNTPHGPSVLQLHDQKTIMLEAVTSLPLQTDGEAVGFAKRVEFCDLPKAIEIHY